VASRDHFAGATASVYRLGHAASPSRGDRNGTLEDSPMSRLPRSASAAPLALALAVLAGACTGRAPSVTYRPFDPDSIPEAYARSTAALMWPGTTRSWQVSPAGDLYDGEWLVRLIPSSDADTAAAPKAIAFEERWLPVAHWKRVSGEVRWDFEAVGLPERAPRDSCLIVSVQVRASNLGSGERTARLDVRVEPPQSPLFVAFDAPEQLTAAPRLGSGASADTVQGWCAKPGGGRMPGLEMNGTGAGLHWTLAPGASGSARLVLPAYPATESALARWAESPHQRRVEEARRYWTSEVERGARFSLGDPEVEAALRAAEVTLLALRERRGPVWVPIGNPFQYRDVWLRDGARAIRALAVLGYTREARELCAGFEGLQWPQGAFLSQRGQLDGTGQALWAFEQALLRPAPGDSVGRYATLAERAWRWIEWQRDLGRGSGWEFGTMLPYGDPRDGELVRAQLVGNDAWALAGYRAAARLMAAAGRGAQAAEVEHTRARYLADFLRALERTDRKDVPPSWQGVGRDWGNLAAVYPCGVLPAGDPRMAALARRVWAWAGGAGLLAYGSPDSIQSYVGADLGTWALLAGATESADSVLAAMLHWRTASGVGAEFFSRTSRDFGTNLPPHATAAAALASLIRDALVFDDDDTLRLTLGARARWWTAGRLERAPTRWGLLDLEFRRRADTAEWRWSPVPVWTALTLPPGTHLAAEPAAPLVRGGSDGVVLAPPGTRQARVRLAASAP
jgi:hypothetical protein